MSTGLDFSEKGMFTFCANDCIKEIFDDFPEELGSTATSPHVGNLFRIRDGDKIWRASRSYSSHSYVTAVRFM